MMDDLKPLDLDAPDFYEQEEAQPQKPGRDVGITLEEDRQMRRHGRRSYLNQVGVANAAKQLARLPDDGESIHGIMRGNFAGFDFVDAIHQLAGARIRELNIATLGFNGENADRLVRMIDGGRIQRATFICSHFYKTSEGEVYDVLRHQLLKRGHRCLAMRCHAKILLFEIDAEPRACYVLEMSANLRSCRNLEQFVLTRDHRLLEFHRGWMYEMLDEADRRGTDEI